MNPEEAVYWHIETAKNALERSRQAMDNRSEAAEPPVAHYIHMMDRIRLVREHMEGLEFEYQRFWDEHLDPHRNKSKNDS